MITSRSQTNYGRRQFRGVWKGGWGVPLQAVQCSKSADYGGKSYNSGNQCSCPMHFIGGGNTSRGNEPCQCFKRPREQEVRKLYLHQFFVRIRM